MDTTDGRDHRGPRILSLAGTASPDLAAVRSWVRTHLDGLGASHVGDVLMVVTELVSNAYEHGGGPLALQLHHTDHPCLVSIEVTDVGTITTRPTYGKPRVPGLGGLGLVLIDRLSTDWGVRYRSNATGKTVWAQVPCEGSGRIPCLGSVDRDSAS